MTRLRLAVGVIALMAAMTTTACAGSDPGGGTGDTSPVQYQPDDEVLRVSYIGGFVAPNFLLTRLPIIAVYGDGRVLTPAAVDAKYPGPALLPVDLRRISVDNVRKLVSLATAAGVGSAGTDYGTPGVADVPNTRFTVLTAGGKKQTEVYALSATNGLTGGQRQARAKLLALQDKLLDLPKTLGSAAVSAASPYVPTSLVVFAEAAPDDGTSVPAPSELAWPGPALPGPATGSGQHCMIVSGDAAKLVLPKAQQANTSTSWTYDGQTWRIAFRALLPAETTCGSLTS
jgi:hypothetical protein